MKILICMTDPSGTPALKLGRVVEEIFDKAAIKMCRSIRELRESLRNPWRDYGVVLLYVANHEELEEYILIQELLEDLPVIFVLPDRNETTSIRAHVVRPRFVTYSDSDFSDLGSVLDKMHLNYRQRYGT